MASWTEFRPLPASPHFTPEDFAETLDGGQSFRWTRIDGGAFEGVFEKTAARLALRGGRVFASFPECADAERAMESLGLYLDCGRDYAAIARAQDDPRALKAARMYGTLRILRQSPAEAIMCFICSSSKRIVQIKQCVALLAQLLGEPIPGSGHNALPSFERIAGAPEETLRSCKIGFRAAYLKKTAQKILSDRFEPESLRQMPYAQAKKYLLSLHGVGEKVADCILLFGAAKFEAFPVDTWISKTMAELYSLENPKSAREFAAKRFGPHAGYVQQLLFAAVRKGADLR